MNAVTRVHEIDGITPDRFAEEVVSGYRPVVLRGLAADWPSVAAGRAGPRAIADYLRRFDSGRPLNVFTATPEIAGRFFYRDDHRGFNFQAVKVLLPALLDVLLSEAENPNPSSLYAGAASAPDNYPGWVEENRLPLPTPDATPRLWLGNATRASTHYDISNNIAVVVAGRRRFAVFPPEQAANLYVGPLETTIAGQPTSMTDLEAPDFDRFPRFAEALAAMQIADLNPGDAIFVPSLWWHDVRASDPFNVLVNYWWGQEAQTSPFAALIHAVLAVRDLPAGQRDAMRAWFDLYVFGDDATRAADHLPPHARGILGDPSPERTKMIRSYLRRVLGDG